MSEPSFIQLITSQGAAANANAVQALGRSTGKGTEGAQGSENANSNAALFQSTLGELTDNPAANAVGGNTDLENLTINQLLALQEIDLSTIDPQFLANFGELKLASFLSGAGIDGALTLAGLFGLQLTPGQITAIEAKMSTPEFANPAGQPANQIIPNAEVGITPIGDGDVAAQASTQALSGEQANNPVTPTPPALLVANLNALEQASQASLLGQANTDAGATAGTTAQLVGPKGPAAPAANADLSLPQQASGQAVQITNAQTPAALETGLPEAAAHENIATTALQSGAPAIIDPKGIRGMNTELDAPEDGDLSPLLLTSKGKGTPSVGQASAANAANSASQNNASGGRTVSQFLTNMMAQTGSNGGPQVQAAQGILLNAQANNNAATFQPAPQVIPMMQNIGESLQQVDSQLAPQLTHTTSTQMITGGLATIEGSNIVTVHPNGLAARPVVYTSAGIASDVGTQISKAFKAGQTDFTIRMNPAELGKVMIKLEFGADGAVRASVVADSRETLNLLQRESGVLERALNDNGLKMDQNNLNFSLKQHNQDVADGQVNDNHSHGNDENDAFGDAVLAQNDVSSEILPYVAGSSRLDIRV
jgi:flagellar hook-length control protein FliK